MVVHICPLLDFTSEHTVFGNFNDLRVLEGLEGKESEATKKVKAEAVHAWS